MRVAIRWSALTGVLAAGATIAAAACFSERHATSPVAGTCSLPIGGDVPGSTIVVIQNFGFQPAAVRVRAGQKVTWVNCEETLESHTTTADAGAWSSPLLAPGQAYTRTFDAVGTFSYHCEPHPFMTGQVVVE